MAIRNVTFVLDAFKEIMKDESIQGIFKKLTEERNEILNILLQGEGSTKLDENEVVLLKRAWNCEEFYTVEFTFDNCVQWFKSHLNTKSYGSPAIMKYKSLDDGEVFIQVFLVDNGLQLGNTPIRIINTSKIDERLNQSFGEKTLLIFK